jgi:hypothetical protein
MTDLCPAQYGGKRHEMPCHHNLEEYLTAYTTAQACATI